MGTAKKTKSGRGPLDPKLAGSCPPRRTRKKKAAKKKAPKK